MSNHSTPWYPRLLHWGAKLGEAIGAPARIRRSLRFRRDSAYLKDLRERLVSEGLRLNHAFSSVPFFREYASEEKIRAVASRSLDVLKAYRRGNRDALNELIAARTYVFVIGSPRTGGTYTTTHLREALCEYRKDDPVVLNESIPTFDHFALSSKDHHEKQVQYSLIQWLVWIDMCYGDMDVVVKKSSGFPFAMDLVDQFMGDARCHYVVTTRHPGAIFRSHENLSKEHGGSLFIPIGKDSYLFEEEPPEWWVKASRRVRTLYYWSDLYGRLTSTITDEQKKRCYVVRYGKQESVISEVVKEINPARLESVKNQISQDSFLVRSREYKPFWYSRVARSVINERRRQWENEGLPFPVDQSVVE